MSLKKGLQGHNEKLKFWGKKVKGDGVEITRLVFQRQELIDDQFLASNGRPKTAVCLRPLFPM